MGWREITINETSWKWTVSKYGDVILKRWREKRIIPYRLIKNLPFDYDVERAKWKGYFHGVTPGDIKEYLKKQP